MANNQVDLGKVTPVEGEDLSVLEHVTYNSEKDQLDSDKPLVEIMTGYSFSIGAKNNITITNIYTSVSKNGNKLTFVSFVQLTRTGTVENDWCNIGTFTIPNNINSKLYPFEITGSNRVLDARQISCWNSLYTAPKYVSAFFNKNPYSPTPYIEVHGINNLELNTDYFARFEYTLLLSDNLAQ